MDKGLLIIGGLTVVILAGIIIASMNDPKTKLANSFKGTDAEVVSEQGMHIHPNISIMIDGQPQQIPTNLGISGVGPMGDIHTHDSTGEIHWEMNAGPVKKGNLKLVRLFETWGKPFSKDQILDAKADGKKITMLVNGQPNTEYENYVINDKDKIEIRYE